MINITDAARDHIKRLMSENGFDPQSCFFRVGVQGGGCSGFTYSIDFDMEKTPRDKEFESNGIKILVDKKSFLYLNGTTVDYKTVGLQAGFSIDNPLAKSSCGCGHSFQP
jgi:iron-sulfur cluster assembly protein